MYLQYIYIWVGSVLTVEGARDDGGGGCPEVEEDEDVVDEGGLFDASGDERRHDEDDGKGEEVRVRGQGGQVQGHRLVKEVTYFVADQFIDVDGHSSRHAGTSCRTFCWITSSVRVIT